MACFVCQDMLLHPVRLGPCCYCATCDECADTSLPDYTCPYCYALVNRESILNTVVKTKHGDVKCPQCGNIKDVMRVHVENYCDAPGGSRAVRHENARELANWPLEEMPEHVDEYYTLFQSVCLFLLVVFFFRHFE